ncbi:hypothetical protein FHG87_022081 [Trinorchestia longiramus]|nr:hypothetical protein FHG87_022081 [Trinorchestia longiramus]
MHAEISVYGACSQFGHSCFGAHGKRSGSQVTPPGAHTAVQDDGLSFDAFNDYEYQGPPALKSDEYQEVPATKPDEYLGVPGPRSDEYSFLAADYYESSPTTDSALHQKLASEADVARRDVYSPWTHVKRTVVAGRPEVGNDDQRPLRMHPGNLLHRPSAGRVPPGGIMEDWQRAGNAGSLWNFKNWLLGVMQASAEQEQQQQQQQQQHQQQQQQQQRLQRSTLQRPAHAGLRYRRRGSLRRQY